MFFNYRLSRDQSLLSTINNQQLQTHSQNNQNLQKTKNEQKTKNRAERNIDSGSENLHNLFWNLQEEEIRIVNFAK